MLANGSPDLKIGCTQASHLSSVVFYFTNSIVLLISASVFLFKVGFVAICQRLNPCAQAVNSHNSHIDYSLQRHMQALLGGCILMFFSYYVKEVSNKWWLKSLMTVTYYTLYWGLVAYILNLPKRATANLDTTTRIQMWLLTIGVPISQIVVTESSHERVSYWVCDIGRHLSVVQVRKVIVG